MAETQRLTREAWIDAAIDLVGRDGVSALRVEPLARVLGTTKGSFYWHFADRAALLDAVLATWQQTCTEQVITEVESANAPARLDLLISTSMLQMPHEKLELALISAAEQTSVGPIVDAVHTMRIDYLSALFAARGLSGARARARARVVYAAYLGNLMLRNRIGNSESAQATRAFRDEVSAMVDPQSAAP